MRVVIDSNVWISAVINHYGTPARVVEAVTAGDIVAVVTQHLLDELTVVLIRPKFRRWVSAADAVAFVEAYELWKSGLSRGCAAGPVSTKHFACSG